MKVIEKIAGKVNGFIIPVSVSFQNLKEQKGYVIASTDQSLESGYRIEHNGQTYPEIMYFEPNFHKDRKWKVCDYRPGGTGFHYAIEPVDFLEALQLENPEVNVMMRKFKNDGELIAVFPYEITSRSGYVNSYMHVGQHSDCSMDIIADTMPAKASEYSALLDELKAVGYENIKVVTAYTKERYYSALRKFKHNKMNSATYSHLV